MRKHRIKLLVKYLLFRKPSQPDETAVLFKPKRQTDKTTTKTTMQAK